MDPNLSFSFCSPPPYPFPTVAVQTLNSSNLLGISKTSFLIQHDWKSGKRYLQPPLQHLKIPPSACVISTPLSLRAWTDRLASHSSQQLVRFFLDGIFNGFQLGFNHTQSTLKSAGKNLLATMAHLDRVLECLQHEISLKRVAILFHGPFYQTSMLADLGLSPKVIRLTDGG